MHPKIENKGGNVWQKRLIPKKSKLHGCDCTWQIITEEMPSKLDGISFLSIWYLVMHILWILSNAIIDGVSKYYH